MLRLLSDLTLVPNQRMSLRLSWLNPFSGKRSKAGKQRSYAEVVHGGGCHDIEIDRSTHSFPDTEEGSCGTDVGGRDDRSWEIAVGREELEKNEAEIQKRDVEVQRMRQEKCELEKRLGRAERQIDTMNQSMEAQKRYIEQMNDRSERAEELLQARTKQLDDALTFVMNEGAYSGADAVAVVEALNNKISQAVAYIADSYEIGKMDDVDASGSVELREACVRARGILGENINLELLGSVFHEDDPLVLEIVLKCTIASLCCSFIDAWHTEDPQKEKFLTQIYEGMRETEEQAVSGRWRALTRSYMHRTGNDVTKERLVLNIVDQLAGVLALIGWTGNYQQVQNVVRTRFGDKLSAAVKWAIRLQEIIKQDIISSDFDVLFFGPGVRFDPDQMDEAYAQTHSISCRSPKQILCTTELGLRRRAGTQKGDNEEVLLKSKVVSFPELRVETNLP